MRCCEGSRETLESPGLSDYVGAHKCPNPLDEIRNSIADISKSLARVEKDLAASFVLPVAAIQSDLGKLCSYFGLEKNRPSRFERSESKETCRQEGAFPKSHSDLSEIKEAFIESDECDDKSSPNSRPSRPILRRKSSVMFELQDKFDEANGPFDDSTWASKGVAMPVMYKFWPTCLEKRTFPGQSINGRQPTNSRVGRASTVDSIRSKYIGDASRVECGFPLDPSSKLVLAMDILGVLFYFYELCVVPVALAWDLHPIYVAELLCVAFWILDLAFGFFVGFFQRGNLIMNPLSIAIHYVKGPKFLVSLILVSNDLFILIMDMNDQNLIAMKALHIVKISKICKLARLVKLSYVLHHLNDALGWQRSPAARIFDKLFGAFLFLLVSSHISCCVWYSVGTSDIEDVGRSWLSVTESQDSSIFYQYILSLQFILSQVSLGESAVFAETSLELVMQCLLLVCGIFFFTMLVAYFSAELSDLMMSMRGSTQTTLALQFYCVANSVPNVLAVRALTQVKERQAKKQQFSDDEKDVFAFTMLSSTLRHEIMRSIQTPYLVTHSLFHIWQQVCRHTLDTLCDAAVLFTTLAPADELFACCTPCSTAYHLVRGRLLYSQSPQDSLVFDLITTPVREGSLFCEAALWSLWRHVGRMEAETYSKVLCIDAEALLSVVSKHPVIYNVTAEYARDFHERLITAMPPLAPFPTDLVVPFTESCELLSHHVSILQLEQACTRGKLSIGGLEKAKLRQEIQGQQCTILQTSDKQLTRVVMLSVVQLSRDDSRFYMEVGVVPDGGCEPVCDIRIPGTKRPIGELPQPALERVLSYHFAPFKSQVKTVSTDQEVEIRRTPLFGMTTTYFRAVHYATWTESDGEVPLQRAVLHRMAVETDSALMPQLRKHEVYVFPGQRKGMGLYAWLSRDEIAFLKLGNNAQKWLSVFDFSPRLYHDPSTTVVLDSPRLPICGI